MSARPYAPEKTRHQNDRGALRLLGDPAVELRRTLAQRNPARALRLAQARALAERAAAGLSSPTLESAPEPEPAALTAEQWREAFSLGARTALAACPAPRRRSGRSRSRARLRVVL